MNKYLLLKCYIRSIIINVYRLQVWRKAEPFLQRVSTELAMQSAVLAMIDYVRPSVRLSQPGIMLK